MKMVEGDDVTAHILSRKVTIEGGSRQSGTDDVKANAEASADVAHAVHEP